MTNQDPYHGLFDMVRTQFDIVIPRLAIGEPVTEKLRWTRLDLIMHCPVRLDDEKVALFAEY